MRALVFDLETNGLVSNSKQPLDKQPNILEVFCLVVNEKGEEIETFHSYFNPGKPIPTKITKITSITDDMVKGAPAFMNHYSQYQKLIESCDRVVAHNLSYDMGVTDFEFKRIEEKVKWPSSRVCTVEATEHIKGHRLTLAALHEYLFGESFTGAHRAENDVRALARCYNELVKRGEI